MPLGKGRSRRSGSSSTPVITTIAFVALCVLGVWLLASTPVTPPATTAKTAAATASSFASSVINFRKTIISDDASKITTPFEDLPGDLPENGGSSSSEISNDSQSGENEKEGVTEKEMADQENGGSVKNQESAASEGKNLISDEDQRKRLEHHQQQEDDQLQQKQQPQPEILETRKDPMKAWMTQADQSCLDNEEALAKIRGRQHFEHRERHCPAENPVCLVPFSRWWNSVYPWSITLH